MSSIHGEKLSFGQRNGPDVELVVFGDELYARYETASGHSVVYDDARGRFCYARLVEGAFVSSGVPVESSPPADALLHGKESEAVRRSKSAASHAAKFPSRHNEKGDDDERDPG